MAKSHYCLLEKFNNYFNRKVIKFDTLNEYIANANDAHIPVKSDSTPLLFDFNPNDNVTTEIIVDDVPFTPDYFLELDIDLSIKSRWFVMETVRNRQGQWVYQLKRDVIADNLNNLIEAPIFVHKGMLPDDDPMVLNDEGMSFNQIKTSEVLVKDKSKSSWVVCYLAKSLQSADVNVDLATESAITNYKTLGDLASDLGITESVLSDLVSFDGSPKSIRLCSSTELYFAEHDGQANYKNVIAMATSPDFTSTSGGQIIERQFNNDMTPLYKDAYLKLSNILMSFATNLQNNASSIVAQLPSVLNRTYYLQYGLALPILQSYNGVYIKYASKFYKLRLAVNGNVQNGVRINNSNYSSWATVAQTADPTHYQANGTIDLYFREADVSVYLDEVSREESDVPTVKAKISSARKTCNNQEFDMIAIPASSITLDAGYNIEQTGDLAQRLACALAIKEDANIYDIQLLPYCPIPSIISDENLIDLTNLTENEDFNYIEKDGGEGILETGMDQDSAYTVVGNHVTYREEIRGHYGVPADATFTFSEITSDSQFQEITNIQITQDNDDIVIEFDVTPEVLDGWFYVNCQINWESTSDIPIGALFYVEEASFSTMIEMSLSLKDSMKIDSNCDIYRLVSPNYQGSFDFNVARNGGSVEVFTAYCTYKPFTPFIKVAPNLNYLYGSDYNDNRGLICGGDFSLPRANSAWQSYQLQNKNYQNIFNREIQNLNFMQSIERRNQIVTGAVGILSDVAKGTAGGAIASGGNPAFAIAGGAVAGVASAVGYGIDIDTLARTQRETKQLAIDKFNYQLGNIKALPYTLTKVGAFDISSKIFPILEYYTCTDKEKQALKDKIKWESMTVMRIGTLSKFMNFNGQLNYFKGELIRNDEIADDTHVVNAIYEELLKGVYI